jgi:hypothetical protein
MTLDNGSAIARYLSEAQLQAGKLLPQAEQSGDGREFVLGLTAIGPAKAIINIGMSRSDRDA